MRLGIAKIRGLAFMFWHARHEFYHVLLGVAWAWVLREAWGEFNVKWVTISIVGSLLPDAEHLFYFITYGRGDEYTKEIVNRIKTRQWRSLTVFIERGHKFNTSLTYHNVYVVGILLGIALLSYLYDWKTSTVLIGAMTIHYLFDIGDDFVTLGYLNPNWRRWGNGRPSHHAHGTHGRKHSP